MYVCICNGHREADLKRAAEQGCRTVEEAYHYLGGMPECSQCVSFAEDLLEDAHIALAAQTRQPEPA